METEKDLSFSPYPALLPVSFIIAGTLAAGCPALDLCSRLTVLIFVVPASVALAFLFRKWRQPLFFFVIGFALCLIHIKGPWQSYQRLLPGARSHIELQATVTDAQLIADPDLTWLSPKTNIQIKIKAMRFHENESWQDCRGTVLVRYLQATLHYGQRIKLAGRIEEPAPPALEGSMNFRNFMLTKGIHHTVTPSRLVITDKQAQSWRLLPATLYRLRDFMLHGLLKGIDDRDQQGLLAAMCFGLKNGLSYEDKQRYLRSGEIHLFAVSGLHIGILFSIIMLGLSFLMIPHQWRYLITPVLLIVYVLITGGAPSAMRAWMMLTVWAVGKGLKIPSQPINAVLIAALILIFLNPLHIFQAGFQFSFIIVLCLISGWDLSRKLIYYLTEKHHWVPYNAKKKHWRLKLQLYIYRSLFAMLCAWLGALGLSAWYNQLFLPFSIFSNMLICILAWFILFLGLLKIALSIIPLAFISSAMNSLLKICLWPIEGIATLTDYLQLTYYMPCPPLFLVLLYYLLLAVILMRTKNLKQLYIGLTVLTICVAAMLAGFHKNFEAENRVIVFQQASDNVPCLFIKLEGQKPLLINSGSRSLQYELQAWLQHQGIRELEHLILLDNRVAFCGGTEAVLRASPAASTTLLSDNRRQLKKIIRACRRTSSRFRHKEREFVSPEIQIYKNKDADGCYSFQIRLNCNDMNPLLIDLKIPKHQAASLRIQAGSDAISRNLYFNDRLRIEEINLNL